MLPKQIRETSIALLPNTENSMLLPIYVSGGIYPSDPSESASGYMNCVMIVTSKYTVLQIEEAVALTSLALSLQVSGSSAQ